MGDNITDDEDFMELVNIYAEPRRHRPRLYRERNDCFEYFSEDDFLARYRLPKDAVRIIIDMISMEISSETDWNHAVTAEQKVLIALRFYATGSIQQCVGDFHGFHKSSISRAVYKVSRALASLYREFIKMPETPEQQIVKMQEFYRIARFPKCIGALDCTHVKIVSPGGDNAEIYRNRKDYFSFNVQGICDANLIIQDLVCRWPGSSHDSTIFNNSMIRTKFERGDFNNSLILGDSGYAVKPYLLTPLRNPNTRAEQLYNESQIRTRNPIERCFGVLKKRFSALALGLKIKAENVPAVIYSCAILHNIARELKLPEPPVNDEVLRAIENDMVEVGAVRERGGINNIRRETIINQHFARAIQNDVTAIDAMTFVGSLSDGVMTVAYERTSLILFCCSNRSITSPWLSLFCDLKRFYRLIMDNQSVYFRSLTA